MNAVGEVRPSTARPYVLVVDDNPIVSTLIVHVLSGEGYETAVAANGGIALQMTEERLPDLILLDLDMPRLSGEEVCRRLKGDARTRLIPVVILTARDEFRTKMEAWENGADEFLTKPFHLVEVTTRCRSLLRIKRLAEERDSAEAVVFALARAVEAKSPFTHGHSERVAQFALRLATALGLPASDREVLHKGGLLHDIGKISVPDAILNKPGKLTAEEYAIIKGHSAQGAHIVESLHSVRDAVPLIRWHHERLDGHGYPDGLSAPAIPLLVRVLSVADVYDSLSSDRPYRPMIAHEVCLEMLRDNALEGGLDPELVAVFSSAVAPLLADAPRVSSQAPAQSVMPP